MNILTIVIIVIIVVIIVMFFKYALSDPYTLQTLQSGKTATVIDPSSLATNATNANSVNFAYSIWFYVNDFNYRFGSPKVIFGRMGQPSTTSTGETSIEGVNGLDPCPSVVLASGENNIHVSLGCYPGVDETPTTAGGKTVVHTCTVANIPIQKWVHLVVSVYGRAMDLYLEGKLVKSCLLPGIANINTNSSIYVTPMGGFDGWTSKFQYYPNSLNPQEVYNIYVAGYGNNMFSSLLNNVQVQVSLVKNGTTQSSLTL
jgi:hypothetical protein